MDNSDYTEVLSSKDGGWIMDHRHPSTMVGYVMSHLFAEDLVPTGII